MLHAGRRHGTRKCFHHLKLLHKVSNGNKKRCFLRHQPRATSPLRTSHALWQALKKAQQFEVRKVKRRIKGAATEGARAAEAQEPAGCSRAV